MVFNHWFFVQRRETWSLVKWIVCTVVSTVASQVRIPHLAGVKFACSPLICVGVLQLHPTVHAINGVSLIGVHGWLYF